MTSLGALRLASVLAPTKPTPAALSARPFGPRFGFFRYELCFNYEYVGFILRRENEIVSLPYNYEPLALRYNPLDDITVIRIKKHPLEDTQHLETQNA